MMGMIGRVTLNSFQGPFCHYVQGDEWMLKHVQHDGYVMAGERL